MIITLPIPEQSTTSYVWSVKQKIFLKYQGFNYRKCVASHSTPQYLELKTDTELQGSS